MTGYRIEDVHVFVATAPVAPGGVKAGPAAHLAGDGDEGVIGHYDEHTRSWVPLICSRPELLPVIAEQARRIAGKDGAKVRVLRFSNREDVTDHVMATATGGAT